MHVVILQAREPTCLGCYATLRSVALSGAVCSPLEHVEEQTETKPRGVTLGTIGSPHVEHSSPHAGPHAGMHSGPQTGADPHQPCVGERNSMKDGRRQLLPKQLQPDAATTTVRTITHDTIRDIVGFSSPRQSAEPTDDTSIRDRGEKTVAHRYDTGGLRVAFSSRARGGTVRLRESGKHC